MAKKKAISVASATDTGTALLQAIAAGTVERVSKDQATPFMPPNPQLIEVNTADLDEQGRAAVRLSAAGVAHLELVAKGTVQVTSEPVASPYAIITNAVLPPSRRGEGLRGGAPKVYPFDDLAVGQTFFVPISVKHPDPVKTLGSTVSSANMRYATETGATKQVNRAKRGSDKKALLDEKGEKIMELVTVPVYEYSRKFALRAVVKGTAYGDWVAPDTGALIARVK